MEAADDPARCWEKPEEEYSSKTVDKITITALESFILVLSILAAQIEGAAGPAGSDLVIARLLGSTRITPHVSSRNRVVASVFLSDAIARRWRNDGVASVAGSAGCPRLLASCSGRQRHLELTNRPRHRRRLNNAPIPLNDCTFLQWMSTLGGIQHESGSTRFGTRRRNRHTLGLLTRPIAALLVIEFLMIVKVHATTG